MAFADSALDRFTRVAPELAGYIISFYDMTDELPEQSGMSVGVFILVIGTSTYYVPVVANGATVHPIDSIYSKDTAKFLPLTKSIMQHIIASGQMTMGTPALMPNTVVRNPSVQELVEPPKTGKYMYAGTAIPETLARIGKAGLDWFMTKVATDKELVRNMHKVGINLLELQKTASIIPTRGDDPRHMINDHEILNTGAPVRVLSEPEEGLEDAAIQMILSQGYAIVGCHPTSRVAVEYDRSTEGFTRISQGCPGKAYEVVFKDGRNRIGFIPDFIRRQGLGEMPKRGRDSKAPESEFMVIFEDGSYAQTSDAVIRQVPRDYVAVYKALVDAGKFCDISDMQPSDVVMIVTPKGFAGPMQVKDVRMSSSGMTINGYKPRSTPADMTTILVSAGIDGDAYLDGDDLYVSPRCKVLKVTCGCDCDIERDINKAITRHEATSAMFIKEAHTIDHDGVEYFVDGRVVGGIAKVAKVLAVDFGLDPEVTSHFIKTAQEKHRVVIQMSAASDIHQDFSKVAAINGVGPADNENTTLRDIGPSDIDNEIPEYGSQLAPDVGNAMSGRTDRSGHHAKCASFDTAILKEAAVMGDTQVAEASVMSELLKDPSMAETISSYMPTIDEALDKLGRTILLLRINNSVMLDQLAPEDYASLVSSIRNTYKLLGENKVTLEQLVANGGQY